LGISWIADTAALFTHPWAVSLAYRVGQAGLIGMVLLPRVEAAVVVWVLVAVAITEAVMTQVQGPPILTDTVARLTVVGIAWPRTRGRLRQALLLLFGLGWLAWMGYGLWPGWASWGVYQGCRALGTGWFCWAREHVPSPEEAGL
jgi:hypothetical protein